MKRNVTVIAILVLVAVISFLVGQKTGVEQPQVQKPEVEKKVTLTFEGAEKHEVSLAEAKKYIQNHKKITLAQMTKAPKIEGGSLNRAIFDKILAQPNCDGIRAYFAQTEDGSPTLVFVGITSAGEDMTNGVIAEAIKPCPPWCGKTSDLR